MAFEAAREAQINTCIALIITPSTVLPVGYTRPGPHHAIDWCSFWWDSLTHPGIHRYVFKNHTEIHTE